MTIINRDGSLYLTAQSGIGTYVAPVQNTNNALPAVSDGSPMTLANDGDGVVSNQFSPRGGVLVGKRMGQHWESAFSLKLPVYSDTDITKAANPVCSILFGSTPCLFSEAGTKTLTLTPSPKFSPDETASNTNAPTVCAMTFFQGQGNLKKGVDFVHIIEKISAKADEPIMVDFKGLGRCLTDTPANSVVDLSTTFATTSTVTENPDYFVLRGATLTLSGPTGSGAMQVRGFEFVPGQTLNASKDAQAKEGYNVAVAFHGDACTMKLSLAAVPESDRAFYAALFADTATTATLLVPNTAGTHKFTIALAAGRITALEESADNDELAYDLTVIPGSVDNTPAYTCTWGEVA